MQPDRTIHRGEQRHLDVEEVHQDLFALAIDLVVAPWGEKIEAVERYPLHESIAAAGQDDHAVVRVRADRMTQVDELFVGMAVEDERTAVGVQRDSQNASRRPAETGIEATLPVSRKA